MKSNQELFDMKGRVVIITGGAGVLGTHFAETLSEAGAHVAIGDLDQEKCDAVAQKLKDTYKAKPLGLALDLTKEESIAAFVKKVADTHGKIDVLINNAATKSKNFFAPFDEYPLEDWNQVMAVNSTGMFLMAKHVVPHMLKQGKGSIINIASIQAVVGPTKEIYEGMKVNNPAVYSVSKGGVIQLTKYLAVIYGDKGIRCNTISPGGVSEHQLGGNEFYDRYSKRTPMHRMATKEDLKGPILFLASDASSYVTGHNLLVDGGWTTW
jgi:NAD(P)-dependent dehydrogenase (short-subunit alcohol dehydrogenase family)